MLQTQMIKGFIEGFILETLHHQTLSSIEIIKYMKERAKLDISEGTIYPLMLRMEKDQLVIAEQIYNPNGPKIKKYSITKLGQKELIEIKEYWQNFKQTAETLLEDKT